MSSLETRPSKKQKTLLEFYGKEDSGVKHVCEERSNQNMSVCNKDTDDKIASERAECKSVVIDMDGEAKSSDGSPDLFPEWIFEDILKNESDKPNSSSNSQSGIRPGETAKTHKHKIKKKGVASKGFTFLQASSDGSNWRLSTPNDLKGDLGVWGVPQLPPANPSTKHTVLYEIPIPSNDVPHPHPAPYVDAWDSQHVRLPCSSQSLYPVQLEEEDKEKTLVERWKIVCEALSRPLDTSDKLEAAIISYNTRYASTWHFSTLHHLLGEEMETQEAEIFFSTTLPAMQRLALQLPELVTRPIPLLRRKRAASVTLTQQQIACLLANAFFCTYPRRNSEKRDSEYATFPNINFNRLFQETSQNSTRRVEKVKCLLHYFRRVTEEVPVGTVTFCRQVLPTDACPEWEASKETLPKFTVSAQGTIEKEGIGMLQVDFANRFIGGGTLNWGCVQEEIRFVICPELIAACLFTEALEPNECLLIAGCERYSCYSGYSENFEWTGDYRDDTPRDDSGRRLTTVLAIDALRFRNTCAQFYPHLMQRELNKAYCGFRAAGIPKLRLTPVASGNWGCGAFRGDPRLKSLLQLMSAAVAGRSLAYFTFGDESLSDDIVDMYTFLQENGVTVGRLWKLLCAYQSRCIENGTARVGLYAYLYQAVRNETSIPRSPSISKSLLSPSKNLQPKIPSVTLPTPNAQSTESSRTRKTKCEVDPEKELTEDEIQEALSKMVDGASPVKEKSPGGSSGSSKVHTPSADEMGARPEREVKSRLLASLEALDASGS